MSCVTFRGSKLLGTKQGVDEVGAEPDGDQQSDEGIAHCRPLKPVAECDVGTHEGEAAEAEGEKDNVEHAAPPVSCRGGQIAQEPHKLSIGNSGRRYKDGIKID
jgi:hypothetical protein